MDKIKLHSNSKEANRNLKAFKRLLIVAFIFAFVVTPILENVKVVKAATLLVVSVDYTDESVNVIKGAGNSTKFYMSTDGKKTWESIEEGKNDISAILSTKQLTVYFKGNKDTEPVPLVIPAEDKSLAPAYKVVTGSGRIEFTAPAGTTVQYRKGQNGSWMTAVSPLYTLIYETKGATLYFRTAPTTALRAGKVVTVKVPKKPNAPSVKLDGSKLCVSGLKSGASEYRVGDNLIWTPFTSATKANYLDLATLLIGNVTGNAMIPAGVIEVRTPSNDKKVASAVKVIEVAQQPTINNTVASVTGSSLAINDTTPKRNYEYTVVAKGSSVDLSKAKWSTITSKRSVVLQKVNVGDKVLVRLKSTVDSTTKQVILASTYVEYPIDGITPK